MQLLLLCGCASQNTRVRNFLSVNNQLIYNQNNFKLVKIANMEGPQSYSVHGQIDP